MGEVAKAASFSYALNKGMQSAEVAGENLSVEKGVSVDLLICREYDDK